MSGEERKTGRAIIHSKTVVLIKGAVDKAREGDLKENGENSLCRGISMAENPSRLSLTLLA